jgi:hypothetical protein
MKKAKTNTMSVTFTNGSKLSGNELDVLSFIHAINAGQLISQGSLSDMIEITFKTDHVLGPKGTSADVPRPLAAALLGRDVARLAKK